MARYRVTAAAVVARVDGPRREVYLYRGVTLPAEVPADEAARLVERGLVAEVQPVVEPVKPTKPQAPKPAAK